MPRSIFAKRSDLVCLLRYTPHVASAPMPVPLSSIVTHYATGALEFTDSTGTRWTVSEIPRFEFSEQLMALLPHPERRAGWLLFESTRGDRRRLAPFPEDWRNLPAVVLEQHLAVAVPAGSHERRRRTDARER